MKSKTKLSIVALFSCCAMMSMGFANWVITQQGPVESTLEGGISADGVLYSDDYVYPQFDGDKIKVDELYLGKTEFLATEHGKGIMNVHLMMDADKCKEFGAKKVVITMHHSPAFPENDKTRNIFTWCQDPKYYITASAAAGENGSFISMAVESDGMILTATIPYESFGELQGKVPLVIKYDFNNIKGAIYKQAIYDVFSQESNDEYVYGFAFEFKVDNKNA